MLTIGGLCRELPRCILHVEHGMEHYIQWNGDFLEHMSLSIEFGHLNEYTTSRIVRLAMLSIRVKKLSCTS